MRAGVPVLFFFTKLDLLRPELFYQPGYDLKFDDFEEFNAQYQQAFEVRQTWPKALHCHIRDRQTPNLI